MTERRRSMLLPALVLAALAAVPLAPAASLAPYGTVANSTTAGLAGAFTGTLAAGLAYRDDGATAGSLDATEAVYLDLDNDGVDQNDILLSTAGGTPGTQISSTVSSTQTSTSPNGALTGLLMFHDTLPVYAEGGPDGEFNPGEVLFLDVNNDDLLSTNDLVLAGGSPGSRQSSTVADTIWHGAAECIYQGTGTTVAAGMRRVTACGAFLAGSFTVAGDADVVAAAALSAVSGLVANSVTRTVTDGATTATSTTVTSATAAFTAADVGRVISGGSIPANSRIVSINSGTSVEISAAATSTATAVSLTIGSSTVFEPGETAWFGSGTVASGHYDVVGTPGQLVDCVQPSPVGSCGTATQALSGTLITRVAASSFLPIGLPTPVGWLDMNGNAVYDGGDRVYADFDGNGFASPADVRFVSGSFGTRPALGDLDSRAVLVDDPQAALPIWQDTDGDNSVDPTEAVALSLDGDARFDFGDVPVLSVGGCTAGNPRLGTTTCGAPASGTWKDATAAAPAMWVCFHDEGVNGATRGDGLYLHLGTGCTTATANDVRVTQSSVGGTLHAGGALVPASGSDNGATLETATLGADYTIEVFDADGSGDVSPADYPYLEAGTGNDEANVMDARLHNKAGLAFGAFLSETVATDKDTVVRFTNMPATPTFAYLDLNGDTAPSADEPVYLRPSGAACTTALTANDLRLAAGTVSGATPGGSVAGSSTESGKTCTDLGSAAFAFRQTPYDANDMVVLDLNGDLVLNEREVVVAPGAGNSGATAGGKATASTTGINQPVTAMPGAIRFSDSNGNGAVEAGEPIVVDADGNSLFSTGDVVLGGTGVAAAPTTPTTPTTPTNPTPSSSVSQSSSSASSSSASSSTSASSSSSGSDTDSDTDEPSQPTEASMNEDIAASLDVDRDDGDNVLTWEDVGADFYQVWGATSPYALEDELPGSQTSYRDEDAPAGKDYLVTACIGACTLTEDDVNEGDVPGHDGVPKGEDAAKPGGFIPGPSPALVVLALVGLALLAARRRLV